MLSIQKSIRNFGFIEGLKIYLQIKRNQGEKIISKAIRHEVHLRKQTTDHSIFKQIFIRNEYDLDVLKSIEVNTILDLGANIGLASVFFKNFFNTNPKIYLVEPHEENVAMIRKNLKNYDNYEILPFAVWDKKTKLRIVDNNQGHCGFEVMEDEKGDIQSISIRDIMSQGNIEYFDIIKMDIEGSEKNVLSNGIHKWLPKTKVLFVELHDRLVPGCSDVLKEVVKKYNFKHIQQGEFDIFINNDLVA